MCPITIHLCIQILYLTSPIQLNPFYHHYRGGWDPGVSINKDLHISWKVGSSEVAFPSLTFTLSRNSQIVNVDMNRVKYLKKKWFGIVEHLNLSIWNMLSIMNKQLDLIQDAGFDFVMISETKRKERGTCDLRPYIMIYSSMPLESRGVHGLLF